MPLFSSAVSLLAQKILEVSEAMIAFYTFAVYTLNARY